MEKMILRRDELKAVLDKIVELRSDAAEYLDKLNTKTIPLLRGLAGGAITFDEMAEHLNEIDKYERFRALDFDEAGKPYLSEIEDINRKIKIIRSADDAKQQRQKYVDFRNSLIQKGGANMFEKEQLDRLASWMPDGAGLERHRLYAQLMDYVSLQGEQPPFLYDGELLTADAD